MHPIELVIFDCDGVITDSELLANQIASDLLKNAGIEISEQELSENYCGYVFTEILKDLEKKSTHPIPAKLIDQLHEEFIHRLPTDLQAIEHIQQTISVLDIAYCICSNGREIDIINMLKHLELYQYFENKIFSAQDHGSKKLKPAPDIFLYAAEKFNVKPEHCLVIEDSPIGIKAAKAANMRVIGFTGGGHSYPKHSSLLAEAGAETVYNKHKDLPSLIKALKEWKDLEL